MNDDFYAISDYCSKKSLFNLTDHSNGRGIHFLSVGRSDLVKTGLGGIVGVQWS